MRVLFSSTRGTGHIQPLLPYARALVARGHDVCVAGPAELADTLREATLTHAVFGHPGDETLAPIWARLRQATQAESHDIAIREIFAGANARAGLPQLLATVRSWRPDLIVRESVEYAALVAAQVASVPCARVAVHSVSFEASIPALAAGPLDALRAQAGLAPDHAAALRAEPVFCVFPASFDGSSDDGSETRIPFRTRPGDDEVSSAAARWAPDTESLPLVYITFGTIAGSSAHHHRVYRSALDAVAELPVRALLTTGRGLGAGALGAIPTNVQVEEFVPQRDVLPHVAALLCHGGSGTVLGALAAGVPMVVVPMFADQPHNAARVAAIGAGLKLENADVPQLRAAIERVLGELSFRNCARSIAHEIAGMPTIDAAVDALLALAQRPTR